MRAHPVAAVLAAIGLAVSSGGCGGGNAGLPPLGKVGGTVKYKGQPLTSGTVTFTPITGKGADTGHIASGPIESDGTYTLTTFDTGDGAVLGQHAVTVVVRDGTADMKTLNMNKGGDPNNVASVRPRYVLPKLASPRKYSDASKTPLKYTVKEGTNTFDLELKD